MGIPIDGDYRLAFPSKFISSADLKDRDVTIKIARIEFEDLQLAGKRQKERRVVVTMTTANGKTLGKRWVMNKTNAGTVSEMYGKKMGAWIGKPVTLYPTTCKLGPKTVECIRVRAGARQAASEDLPEEFTREPDEDAAPHDFADAADAADEEDTALREKAAAEKALGGRQPGDE